MHYIKAAAANTEVEERQIRGTVERMLADIERRGEDAVAEYARRLDCWEGEFVLSSYTTTVTLAGLVLPHNRLPVSGISLIGQQ